MKEFRIYRSKKPSNGGGSYNTYLQYFPDMKSAQEAKNSRDKWDCSAVHIEKYDRNIGRWIVYRA